MSDIPKPSRRSLTQHIISSVWAVAELFIVICTGILIYVVYVVPREPGNSFEYLAATVIFAFMLWLALSAGGQYNFDKLARPRKSLKNFIVTVSTVFLILVFCSFALKISANFSRAWAASWFVSILILVPLFRYSVSRYVRQSAISGTLTKDIIIYGAGANGELLVKLIDKLDQPWNRIVGIFDDRTSRVPKMCGGHAVRGNTSDLVDYARTNGCDEILLAMPLASANRYLALATQLSPLPVNVRIVPDLTVFEIPQLPATADGVFGIPMINVLKKPVSGWGVLGKWAIDIFLTGIAVLFALPLIAIVAILIKLDSTGPVLFKQTRQGFQNQLFDVYKFRTMFIDCEDSNAEMLTTRNDPRVTRVGAWLRRFSIDELPQLFNVLKGDMSLVGPRPHALMAKAGGKLYADVLDAYSIRMKVKPGLTGWAQVNGWRGNTETEEDLKQRVHHDLYYIENWSPALDILVLFMTVRIVLVGENSY